MDHWISREWEDSYLSKRCEQELKTPPDEIRTVKIGDVIGVYVVLCVGCGLSIVIFLAERLTLSPGGAGRLMRKLFSKRQGSAVTIELEVITLNNGRVLKSR